MSPLALTIPFKKIVPKVRRTNWVMANTVVIVELLKIKSIGAQADQGLLIQGKKLLYSGL
jgi:hypothetical protein